MSFMAGGGIPLASAPAKVPELAEGPSLPCTPTAGLIRRPATPGLFLFILLNIVLVKQEFMYIDMDNCVLW